MSVCPIQDQDLFHIRMADLRENVTILVHLICLLVQTLPVGQLNEERLQRIEAGLHKHTVLENNERFSGPSYKFNKKVYEDQFSFNLSMVDHLHRALESEDPFQKEVQINEGINKIVKRNK